MRIFSEDSAFSPVSKVQTFEGPTFEDLCFTDLLFEAISFESDEIICEK